MCFELLLQININSFSQKKKKDTQTVCDLPVPSTLTTTLHVNELLKEPSLATSLFWVAVKFKLFWVAQKQFLFGQKRNSGEEKKSKASVLVSFPNWASLGTAYAVSVLETTICHSSLTRWWDRNVVAEPTKGNMLAAYPKQTCKIQLLLLQIFRQEDFPKYKFGLLFFN